jgi:hypothetical protein
MNIVKVKYWSHRMFPTLSKYNKVIKRHFQNNYKFFQPEIFKTLENLDKNLTNFRLEESSKKILIFATRQDPLHITWELVLAKSLELRNHVVEYIACDGLIRESCNESWYPNLPLAMCRECNSFAEKLYLKADLRVKWLSEYFEDGKKNTFVGNKNIIQKEYARSLLEKVSFKDYKNFTYRNFPLGELVRPSVCHFTRNEDLELSGRRDPHVITIYKNFLINAIFLVDHIESILNSINPDIVMMINGRFITEAIMLNWLKIKGIKSVIYESGIMPDSISILHNNHIDYMKVSNWDKQKNKSLSQKEEEKLFNYLQKRKTGKGQRANYWKNIKEDVNEIKNQLDLNKYNSISCLFPNLLFDSANHGKHVQYKTMKEWLASTIKFFSSNPSHALVIRVHPAEVKWPQVHRDSVLSWIKSEYGKELSQNIKVIGPFEDISSYALMKMSDLGLVSTSTTGLEMALIGKPVIVTGKVHYWNKGFTIDPSTDDEYHEMLNSILKQKNIPKLDFELAKTYAYHIFFESSFGLKSVNSENYRTIPPKLEISSFDELLPGNDPNLDKICDGIVKGTPFV